MTTFIVTFRYLGHDWFLCAKSWTEELARASCYVNEEAAAAALATARRYMRNKQPTARVVLKCSAGEIPVKNATQTSSAAFSERTRPGIHVASV